MNFQDLAPLLVQPVVYTLMYSYIRQPCVVPSLETSLPMLQVWLQMFVLEER